MHRVITTDLAAPPERTYGVLSDLATFSGWLDLVDRAEVIAAAADEPGPAWMVTLRAKVGPLARSKRLRMVRVVADDPRHVRFERREHDGRTHAPWILDALIEPTVEGSRAIVELRYDGSFWTAPLDAILGSQIRDAIPRLRNLTEGPAPG